MRPERSSEPISATGHWPGIDQRDPPLPYNVPRLDTFLQGKTRLRGALEMFVTIALLLLLAMAIGVLRVHAYWPVDAPRSF